MLRLQPGAALKGVREGLVEAHRAITQPLNAADPSDAFVEWGTWVANQVVALRGLISDDDLNRLIRSRLYWSLIGTNSNYISKPQLRTVVQDELLARKAALEAELKDFDNDVHLWGGAVVVVPDTSVFVEMGGTFADHDWHERLDVNRRLSLYLVVTMAAVVELDSKKLSRDSSADGVKVRTKVRAALARIEELFPTNSTREETTHQKGIQTTVTTVLLTDDLDHVPLPSADAEMIARGLDLLPYAERSILLSYDLNQTFRARASGLESVRLRYDDEASLSVDKG